MINCAWSFETVKHLLDENMLKIKQQIELPCVNGSTLAKASKWIKCYQWNDLKNNIILINVTVKWILIQCVTCLFLKLKCLWEVGHVSVCMLHQQFPWRTEEQSNYLTVLFCSLPFKKTIKLQCNKIVLKTWDKKWKWIWLKIQDLKLQLIVQDNLLKGTS